MTKLLLTISPSNSTTHWVLPGNKSNVEFDMFTKITVNFAALLIFIHLFFNGKVDLQK